MDRSTFLAFFDCCVGSWVAERTYHYPAYSEIERSRTEFTIAPLTTEVKQKVLSDNQYPLPSDLSGLPGFNLGFYTISDKGEEVTQNLNLLFVPQQQEAGGLTGDYLRDRAYEEAKPIISQFRFVNAENQLLMRTNYTRTVSLDSIRLLHDDVRLRQILNYQRPPEGHPLDKLTLVGFGLEQKVN